MWAWLVSCFWWILSLVVAAGFGYLWGVSQQRRQAVESGVGRWIVDAHTGCTAFVYVRSESEKLLSKPQVSCSEATSHDRT